MAVTIWTPKHVYRSLRFEGCHIAILKTIVSSIAQMLLVLHNEKSDFIIASIELPRLRSQKLENWRKQTHNVLLAGMLVISETYLVGI